MFARCVLTESMLIDAALIHSSFVNNPSQLQGLTSNFRRRHCATAPCFNQGFRACQRDCLLLTPDRRSCANWIEMIVKIPYNEESPRCKPRLALLSNSSLHSTQYFLALEGFVRLPVVVFDDFTLRRPRHVPTRRNGKEVSRCLSFGLAGYPFRWTGRLGGFDVVVFSCPPRPCIPPLQRERKTKSTLRKDNLCHYWL